MKCTTLAANMIEIQKIGVKGTDAVAKGAQFFATWSVIEIKANLYPGHGVDTGVMKGGYQSTISGGTNMKTVTVFNEVEYAAMVEYMQGGRIAHFWPGIQSALAQTEAYLKGFEK